MGAFSLRFRFQHWLPKVLRVQAIVLYPYILFSAPRQELNSTILCHEMIHVRQVRRVGWFRFYVSYLWEYFSRRMRGASGVEAYRAISFEQEAFRLASLGELTERERREAGLA